MYRRNSVRPMALAGALTICTLFFITALSTLGRQRRHPVALFGEGGIGTFPGGQSTGGYGEFDFEQPVEYEDETATETERLRRLKAKVRAIFPPHTNLAREIITSDRPITSHLEEK